ESTPAGALGEVRGTSADGRRFSVHAKTRGMRRPELSGRTTGTSGGRRAAFAAGALALVAGACAGSTSASSDDANPTFERAAGSSITYEEPVADVADLLAPAAEGQPCLLLGPVY